MTSSLVVFDYGSGNIRSAQRALEHVGALVEVTRDLNAALAADGVVVPGVGAFDACMESLRAVGGDRLVAERVAREQSVLGICVGHQVLFETGSEHGKVTAGLGVLPGQVVRLDARVLPHVGWNSVRAEPSSRMFAGIGEERFYFVHSYAAHDAGEAGPFVAARSTYADDDFVAAVEHGSLWSTQFHPEKSGEAGLALLRNWVESL